MSDDPKTPSDELPVSREPYRASDSAGAPSVSTRGTRVMTVVRWLILAAVALVAAQSVMRYWFAPAHVPSARDTREYYCPMHPQIRSNEPGECPICHMHLEPVPSERRASLPATNASDAATRVDSATVAPPIAAPDAGDTQVTSAARGASDGGLQGVVAVTLSRERQQMIGVTTAPAMRSATQAELRVPGVVEAPENARSQVHVRAPGFIERVAVRETGVRVSAGQVLAWFYSPQIYQAQQELLTAHAWTARAAPIGSAAPLPSPPIELAARRNLALLGMSDADIDAVVRTGTAMRDVPIRAPARGYVSRVAAILGAYATPETTLYEVADLTHAWVIASVFERDLPRVHRGMVARFASTELAGPPLDARVALVEPDVSIETRSARVRLEIDNPGLRLRPGAIGDVTFTLPASVVVDVPRDAVVDTGTAQYVFVDRGAGVFEPRAVRAGRITGDRIEVVSGLAAGQRVVVHGNFLIDSESRLQSALGAGGAGR